MSFRLTEFLRPMVTEVGYSASYFSTYSRRMGLSFPRISTEPYGSLKKNDRRATLSLKTLHRREAVVAGRIFKGMQLDSSILKDELKNLQENKKNDIGKTSSIPKLNGIVYQSRGYASGNFEDNFVTADADLFKFGGYDVHIDLISDYVRYLQNPDGYCKSGVKPPKGMILSGPPGVGKTFLAESIAGHAGVPFIVINGSELFRSTSGETEQLMRELFKKAKQKAPCVLLIDEFDSIGEKRGDNKIHWYNGLVNQMLSLLSQDRSGVIVIATVNNFDVLDPAIVRPGRFDVHITLSLPNIADRKKILEVHTKDKSLHSDVSLDILASISVGFSGAKLAGWVNEAAKYAMRDESESIRLIHFDQARTLLQIGVLQPQILEKEQKNIIATHEAGHAVVGHLLGKRIYKVTILQSSHIGGYTEWIPSEEKIPAKQDLLNEICTSLAGRAAELLEGKLLTGSINDISLAKEIASLMILKEGLGKTLLGSSGEVENILKQELTRAQKLIKKNDQGWKRIREFLIEKNTLLAGEFISLFEKGKLPFQEEQFSLQNKTPKITQREIPPKTKKPVEDKEDKIDKIESLFNANLDMPAEDLPFTIEEIAKVLEINGNVIRKIEIASHKGYIIRFKPSFNDETIMIKLSKELTDHDVEHSYNTGPFYLIILNDGVEDLLKWMGKS